MQYRRLGRTELQVSVLGVGGGYLMLLDQQEGTRLYERAWDLGLNYFDGRYGDSSAKLKPVIKRGRERCVVVSKTQDRTKEQALERVDEDLRELDTDYIDIYYLRTYNHDMLQEHLTPGGSMEGLLEAKAKGKVRFIGLAGHSDLTALAAGIETGMVDAVIFPFNIVRRDALDVLIPAAIKYDVGLVVMKPMNVGLVPAPLALAWLANQPIHTMVPGMSHIEHLEMDVAAVERDPMALTPEEEAAIECARQEADRISCRICDKVCQPLCEAKIPLDWFLYHDVYYNEYLNLGLEQLLEMPLTPWFKASVEGHFARRLAMVQSCTHCGKCEQACPYHIQIMDMFEKMLEDHKIIIDAVHAKGWTETYKDAAPPFQPPRRPGGKK